ncbi:PREDICTED: ecto-NOX disulfide-thiol exchanger 2 isoform X2 [Diuraphis noxia]|uniref:ecto-NOX disulfide-thiol exchanger 2 isoform X2 n=1 Tax=Diuraphis noxia TaxID=143948 RepID=UPI0007638FE2|nr:PREDICTED: ecto-NOX disulfide-thiol exchanger 2 isoform X2 [Diuraphis noxia]
MASYYDAVFRRKITESANIDERNRSSENKRGRWDQPDAQKLNSDEQWERIVERARNLRSDTQFTDIHGDKPASLIDLPIDANISSNKPPVPVRTSPLWNEIMPQFNPFNLINPMNYGIMGGMLTPPSMIVNHTTPRTPDSNVIQTDKRIIQLELCTLYPPPSNAPTPTSRERPPGCRTVFVGGLPDSITEDIMKSIFTNYGEILTIRLSNRKFCHIRFENECSVDLALELSGYRLVMKGQELVSASRLHVDYAQARDDQYEWEMKKRHLMREERRLQQTRSNPPPSPPLIPHFTEAKALSVSEEIKADSSFLNAVQVVITWLERGDCNKRNVNIFYSIIQSTNSHVRRLLSEKNQFEEELQNLKDLTKRRMQAILLQFTQIEKVFTSASHKKVWDHFTKAQRKNIETWKKQAMALSKLGIDDEDEMIGGDEMDLSDDESNLKKTKTKTDPIQLQDENDHLKCELEAYKNEIGMMKASLQTSDQKDIQINYLQQQLLSTRQELNVLTEKCSDAQKSNSSSIDDQLTPSNKIKETNIGSNHFSDHQIKLLGHIAIYLNIHPFGISVESIVNYIKNIDKNITSQQIENLLVTNQILFENFQHDDSSLWKLVNFS